MPTIASVPARSGAKLMAFSTVSTAVRLAARLAGCQAMLGR